MALLTEIKQYTSFSDLTYQNMLGDYSDVKYILAVSQHIHRALQYTGSGGDYIV